MKRLFLWFASAALASALVGSFLTVSFYNRNGWADVGKSLLTLAVTFSVGGAAATLVKVVEQNREEQQVWRDVLNDVVGADQTLSVARQLIAAHKTAKTYSEQYAHLVAVRLTLRRVWLNPAVANDEVQKGEDGAIQDHLDRMKLYVDKLGEEYETSYLPVARQQRIDEEHLRQLITDRASRSHGRVTATDSLAGYRASASDTTLDSNDEVYHPTPAWKMLRDPARFPLLVAFLDDFETSGFVEGFRAVKPMLERRAGIEQRKQAFVPAVLPTHANSALPRPPRAGSIT